MAVLNWPGVGEVSAGFNGLQGLLSLAPHRPLFGAGGRAYAAGRGCTPPYRPDLESYTLNLPMTVEIPSHQRGGVIDS